MSAGRHVLSSSLPVHGERLILRALRPGDALAVSQLVSDPDVVKQTLTMTSPYPRHDAEAWIALELAQSGRKRQVLVVEERQSGVLVGTMSVQVAWRLTGRSGVIGYWIGKPYWGRGFGSEGLSAFLGYCRDVMALGKFEARVFDDNEGSQRVLERNGFRRSGRSWTYVPKRGGWRRIYRYRLKSS